MHSLAGCRYSSLALCCHRTAPSLSSLRPRGGKGPHLPLTSTFPLLPLLLLHQQNQNHISQTAVVPTGHLPPEVENRPGEGWHRVTKLAGPSTKAQSFSCHRDTPLNRQHPCQTHQKLPKELVRGQQSASLIKERTDCLQNCQYKQSPLLFVTYSLRSVEHPRPSERRPPAASCTSRYSARRATNVRRSNE